MRRGLSLLLLLCLIHGPATFADESVRVVDGATVEVWNGAAWEDSGMRPPPAGMTYATVAHDRDGNLAVQLGGRGKGFNFKLQGGAIVLASKIEWAGETPPLFNAIEQNPEGPGFIATAADGRRFVVEAPGKGHWHFTAKPLVHVDVSAAELSSAIDAARDKVFEMKELARMAEERNLRLYLSGEAAASFAHYVKWDLERMKGDTSYDASRFDYDSTHIFGHGQPFDLVVTRADGKPTTAEEIEALGKAISKRFPYAVGEKREWDIRLNQRTSTYSAGLIEITRGVPGEPRVRDLFDGDSAEPRFLKDVASGTLHYGFRATDRLDPPILTAIRYLIEAFQYGLKMDEASRAGIQRVIDEFDPKSVEPGSSISGWIEENGKKLLLNAQDLEQAWNTAEDLKLREKLIAIRGNTAAPGSLAWWLSKEPLRSKPHPKAFVYPPLSTGRTARELGLEYITHVTRNIEAYEAITRSPKGKPNLFISREGVVGEATRGGPGLYASAGKSPIDWISGFPVRLKVDRSAREGVDFQRDWNEIIWRDSSKLTLVPDELPKLTPAEALRFFLDPANHLEESTKFLIARSVRKHLLTSEEEATIREIVSDLVSRRDWHGLVSARLLPQARPLVEKALEAAGFDYARLLKEKELIRSAPATELAIMRLAYPLTKTPEEFLALMHFNRYRHDGLASTNEAMRLGNLIWESADHFLSLRPTIEQVKELEADSLYWGTFFAPFERVFMPLVRTAADYLALVEHSYARPHQFVVQAIDQLVLGTGDFFFRTHPTAEEIKTLLSKRKWTDAEVAAFLSTRLSRASTEAELAEREALMKAAAAGPAETCRTFWEKVQDRLFGR